MSSRRDSIGATIGKRSIATLAPLSAMGGNNPSVDLRDPSRNTNRYSVTQLYSMAAENDTEIEDELARAQKRLRDLKTKISSQSKKNFVLERDVRYLDSRIALLIQNASHHPALSRYTCTHQSDPNFLFFF
ncbi:glyceraldehyde-3-phosphate dehydrogenase 1 [Puccinia graminis f. sp. tritici]|uniref:Glyceraldehyde-3-phosphate dehydrogenase 1 n=1 Tax=Puccinia graminis f. sp. tritici TaxID=56615 RepID=A0A5B0P4H8_PUCGR|nr:glyceraldehyde-3-phosphate dehydrogenase 1 [Puccinia graminis f. sp. tritici]